MLGSAQTTRPRSAAMVSTEKRESGSDRPGTARCGRALARAKTKEKQAQKPASSSEVWKLAVIEGAAACNAGAEEEIDFYAPAD